MVGATLIYVLATRACPESLGSYEQSWGDPPGTRLKVLFYDDLPGRMFLPTGTYVFSDLERLGDAGLELAAAVWHQLGDNGSSRRINDPRRVPRRQDLLSRLSDSGQNRFRVFSVSADLAPLRYPASVESIGGAGAGLRESVHDAAELRRAVWKGLLLGYPKRELLAIERHDAGDRGGVFRRYTADFIGDRVLARALRHSLNPQFKGDDLCDRRFRREREAFLATNPHHEQLRKILRDSCVEFGSVDYGLAGDQIQVWELRCNLYVQHLSTALTDALEALDIPPSAAPDTPLRLAPDLVKRYAAELRSISRRRQVRSGLRGVYSLAGPLWRFGATP